MTLPDDAKRKIEARAYEVWLEAKKGNIHYWTIKDDDEEAVYWRSIWTKGFLESQGEIEALTRSLGLERIECDNTKTLIASAEKALADRESQMKELREENEVLKARNRSLNQELSDMENDRTGKNRDINYDFHEGRERESPNELL